jgi:hypothetical protein
MNVYDTPGRLPIDLDGATLNILYSEREGKVWVCVDGVAVLRVRGLVAATCDGDTLRGIHESMEVGIIDADG